MFKIIGRRSHGAQKVSIDSLLDLFKVSQNFSLDPKVRAKATFIVAENDQYGIYGGAILFPHQNSYPNFTSKDKELFVRIFSFLQPRRKKLWMARICLCVGQDPSSPSLELIDLCESFYDTLYQEIESFRNKKKAGFIAFTMRLADLYHTDALKKWAYLCEIKLKEISDGEFHGIIKFPFKWCSRDQKEYAVFDYARVFRRYAA